MTSLHYRVVTARQVDSARLYAISANMRGYAAVRHREALSLIHTVVYASALVMVSRHNVLSQTLPWRTWRQTHHVCGPDGRHGKHWRRQRRGQHIGLLRQHTMLLPRYAMFTTPPLSRYGLASARHLRIGHGAVGIPKAILRDMHCQLIVIATARHYDATQRRC